MYKVVDPGTLYGVTVLQPVMALAQLFGEENGTEVTQIIAIIFTLTHILVGRRSAKRYTWWNYWMTYKAGHVLPLHCHQKLKIIETSSWLLSMIILTVKENYLFPVYLIIPATILYFYFDRRAYMLNYQLGD